MPTKIFSLAAISFELRCQCPLVTPASLNGNGCAVAAPTARAVDASNKLANNTVFITPSLLRSIRPLPPSEEGGGGAGSSKKRPADGLRRRRLLTPLHAREAR